MDTIGFAIEEWVSLHWDVKENFSEPEPKWKKATKILISLLLLFGLLAFTAYQIYQSIQSYKYPTWSSREEERSSVTFPGIQKLIFVSLIFN